MGFGQPVHRSPQKRSTVITERNGDVHCSTGRVNIDRIRKRPDLPAGSGSIGNPRPGPDRQDWVGLGWAGNCPATGGVSAPAKKFALTFAILRTFAGGQVCSGADLSRPSFVEPGTGGCRPAGHVAVSSKLRQPPPPCWRYRQSDGRHRSASPCGVTGCCGRTADGRRRATGRDPEGRRGLRSRHHHRGGPAQQFRDHLSLRQPPGPDGCGVASTAATGRRASGRIDRAVRAAAQPIGAHPGSDRIRSTAVR